MAAPFGPFESHSVIYEVMIEVLVDQITGELL